MSEKQTDLRVTDQGGEEPDRQILWWCPGCGACEFWLESEEPMPGGPALCAHRSSEYVAFVERSLADQLRQERDRLDDECERLGIVKEEYRAESDHLRAALQQVIAWADTYKFVDESLEKARGVLEGSE